MRALALDPATGDLLTTGGLSLLDLAAAVAQRLRWRLGLGRGEWFADTSLGVPWLQAIVGERGGDQAADAILRAAITTCPGVAALESFTLTLNATTRHATVTFRAHGRRRHARRHRAAPGGGVLRGNLERRTVVR